MDGRMRWRDAELGKRTIRLTRRRMLESTVGDGSEEFGLQEEVAEARGVNANIAAFLVCVTARHGKLGLLGGAVGRGGIGGDSSIVSLQLLVRIIDQIFFVGHVCGVGICFELGQHGRCVKTGQVMIY